MVQTHASYIFLAGPFVYKIKKPVDFGFLDFSTLGRRKRFCEREVELNRRLAPDVYLDVVPIRRAGRGFRLGAGPGPAVEYAVRMRRLADAGFASTRLARGRLGGRDVDRIAARLASFYRDVARTGPGGRLPDRQRRSIEDNLRLIRRHGGDDPAVSTLGAYTRSFYRSHAGLLIERQRQGRILDCHGDLRLEHVHLDGDSVRIYDCIEFNDRLRNIDVANDVAFLAMDLDFEGRPDLAARFVDAVVARTGDSGIYRLLDFYKCYRAAVRHKVEVLRSKEREVSARERVASASRARRFLALALRYATVGSKPTALVVMGTVASGKSTLAGGLARALAITRLSSDETRKRLAGLPLHRRPNDAVRARLYSPRMSRRVYDVLLRAARARLRAGRSVVVDATYGSARERCRLLRSLESRGYVVQFVEVTASVAARRTRLADRVRTTRSVSDARNEDRAALDSAYAPPREIPVDMHVTIRSRSTAERTLAAALRALAVNKGTVP